MAGPGPAGHMRLHATGTRSIGIVRSRNHRDQVWVLVTESPRKEATELGMETFNEHRNDLWAPE